MIRTVLVTPTRLLIGAPQQEPSNSVTRRYMDKIDGIVRVQFTDEEDRIFVSFKRDCAETSGPRVYEAGRHVFSGDRYHGTDTPGIAARSGHRWAEVLPSRVIGVAAKVRPVGLPS